MRGACRGGDTPADDNAPKHNKKSIRNPYNYVVSWPEISIVVNGANRALARAHSKATPSMPMVSLEAAAAARHAARPPLPTSSAPSDEPIDANAALAQCTRDLGFALSKQRQLERQNKDADDRCLSLERRLKAAQQETASHSQRAYEIAQRGEIACEAQRKAQADAASRAEKVKQMSVKLLLLARATKEAEQAAEAAAAREAAVQSKQEDAVRTTREKVQREMRQKVDEAEAREAMTLRRLHEVEGRAQEAERRVALLEQQLRAHEKESRRSRELQEQRATQHAAAMEAAEGRTLCAKQAAAAAERECEAARAKLRGVEAKLRAVETKLGESHAQLEERTAQVARRDEAAKRQAAAARAAAAAAAEAAQLERARLEAKTAALEAEAAARDKDLARCRAQIKKTAALGPQLQSIQHLLDELQPGNGGAPDEPSASWT